MTEFQKPPPKVLRGMTVLRGLTLWQPMAWAISDLPEDEAKRLENRPWPPYRGVTHVAIHAGLRYHQPHADFIAELLGRAVPTKKELPGGAILCIARLDGVVEQSDDDWFMGKYGWILKDVVKLPEPVPHKGAMGMWRIDKDIRKKIWKFYRSEMRKRR